MGWSGVRRAAGVRGLVWAGAAGGRESVVTAVEELALGLGHRHSGRVASTGGSGQDWQSVWGRQLIWGAWGRGTGRILEILHSLF